ncbi:MAG: hypothetical protein NC924_08710, partial [Candidatus Omnitrophica bacterium]|nr:hypothetical protein [Candidatus Omnitrophota bacterium]
VLGNAYFDMYRVSYYLDETLRRRIFFLAGLLSSSEQAYEDMRKDIAGELKRDYERWIDFLIKREDKQKAMQVLSEYTRQFGMETGAVRLYARAMFPTIGLRRPAHRDFFKTERLKNDVVKIHYHV